MGSTPGNKTLLQLSIASTFTTIVQRIEVAAPERTRAKIETTDLDSDDETSISGIRRNGQVKLKCNHDISLATHAALLAAYADGLPRDWKQIMADTGAETDAFSGWVSSYQKGAAKVDGLVDSSLTIEVTGAITNTP